ncbi:hypothetical protein [Hydrogenophaga sp. 5NK40-0174]|uniref:hypothetical protein n=1 Tax=Hydrogenophaga sp. 5NK40-0174 TaxID=3127649 RepID=UPI003107DF24
MSFKAFLDAAKAIISLGASTNAAARHEIREVVGKLGDELDRALVLTDSYLVGAKFSENDGELAKYLADVDGKLMGSYHEHHICAGLYQLADKFDQVFDPTRFSVSITHYAEVPRLINELKNGESVVLDDLRDIADLLRSYSSHLLSGTMSRDEVLAAVETHRVDISRYRKSIRSKKRTLLNKL